MRSYKLNKSHLQSRVGPGMIRPALPTTNTVTLFLIKASMVMSLIVVTFFTVI